MGLVVALPGRHAEADTDPTDDFRPESMATSEELSRLIDLRRERIVHDAPQSAVDTGKSEASGAYGMELEIANTSAAIWRRETGLRLGTIAEIGHGAYGLPLRFMVSRVTFIGRAMGGNLAWYLCGQRVNHNGSFAASREEVGVSVRKSVIRVRNGTFTWSQIGRIRSERNEPATAGA